jgi:hypothetical protein
MCCNPVQGSTEVDDAHQSDVMDVLKTASFNQSLCVCVHHADTRVLIAV